MKSHKSMTITHGRALLIALVAALGFVLAAAPNAAADEDEPFYVVGLADFGSVTAEVAVDCTNEKPIAVTAGNTTTFATNIKITINDEGLLGVAPIGSNMAFIGNYSAAENEVAHVVVTMDGNELANEFLKVNCVPADPWFEFIPDCDAGQAWVELGNNGPDVGTMGVRYTDLPHAGGPVSAGESTVQPLAVQPNQFADFSIEVDGEAIYSGGYFFDCPEPEVVEVEEVEPASTEPAVPEASKPEPELPADEELVKATPEVERTEIITGVGDAEELATGAGLEVGGKSSTSGAILVGLLLALGVALTVGSLAALKMRR